MTTPPFNPQQIAKEAAEQIVPDLMLSGEYAALKLCTRQVAKECVESDVKKTAALILTAAAKMVRESGAVEALAHSPSYDRLEGGFMACPYSGLVEWINARNAALAALRSITEQKP